MAPVSDEWVQARLMDVRRVATVRERLQSLNWFMLCRRSRPSQAKLRSATQRFGSFTNPTDAARRSTTTTRNGFFPAVSH